MGDGGTLHLCQWHPRCSACCDALVCRKHEACSSRTLEAAEQSSELNRTIHTRMHTPLARALSLPRHSDRPPPHSPPHIPQVGRSQASSNGWAPSAARANAASTPNGATQPLLQHAHIGRTGDCSIAYGTALRCIGDATVGHAALPASHHASQLCPLQLPPRPLARRQPTHGPGAAAFHPALLHWASQGCAAAHGARQPRAA
jgi:hypothetical protein